MSTPSSPPLLGRQVALPCEGCLIPLQTLPESTSVVAIALPPFGAVARQLDPGLDGRFQRAQRLFQMSGLRPFVGGDLFLKGVQGKPEGLGLFFFFGWGGRAPRKKEKTPPSLFFAWSSTNIAGGRGGGVSEIERFEAAGWLRAPRAARAPTACPWREGSMRCRAEGVVLG